MSTREEWLATLRKLKAEDCLGRDESCLLDEVDALKARVAELERERDKLKEAHADGFRAGVEAAARTCEANKVDCPSPCPICHSLDARYIRALEIK